MITSVSCPVIFLSFPTLSVFTNVVEFSDQDALYFISLSVYFVLIYLSVYASLISISTYHTFILSNYGWYLSTCLFIFPMKVGTKIFKEIICLSFYRPSIKIYPVYLSNCLSIYAPIYVSLNLSFDLSPNPFNCLSISPPIGLPLYPPVCLFIHIHLSWKLPI